MEPAVSDIERLIAINEIREVMARYARHADQKDFEALARLFTSDGSFTTNQVDGAVWMQIKGRDAIARTIAQSVGTAQVIHHLFSYQTEILSPTSARSVVSMADMFIRPEGEALPSDAGLAFRTMEGYGHYHGDFVKVGEAWFIKTLVQTRLKMDFAK